MTTLRRGRPNASPKRGRYSVRNFGWNAWLRVSDAFLGAFRRPSSPVPTTPGRILLAVGGHLGDAVIATSVLPAVKDAFPAAEIGIVCGSWSACVFESHPTVSRVHVCDHWKASRLGGSVLARWRRFRETSRKAEAGIRAAGYDIAVDLYPYYPNFAPLLSRAGVPVRLGYASGGYAALFTRALEWTPGRRAVEDHVRLLSELARSVPPDAGAEYDLPTPPDASRRAADALRATAAEGARYVVLHPGGGSSKKEWPSDKWIALAQALASDGYRLVLTGSGAGDRRLCDSIASVPGTADINLCDRLSWDDFRSVIACSQLVVSVDTVAMHLAAAAGVSSVAVMTGMDDPERWRAAGARTTALYERVPCLPCYRSRGCEAMSCVRDVSLERVLNAARGYLGETERRSDTLLTSNRLSSS